MKAFARLNGKSFSKVIVVTTLLAGTLDAFAAIIVYGASFNGLFKFIAAAAVGGETAFNGNNAMVFLGLFFHYLITFCWTLLLFLIVPKIQKYRVNPFAIGLFYGIIIWLVMNLVVIPVSALQAREFVLKQAILGMSILILMVGVPISVMAHRYHKRL